MLTMTFDEPRLRVSASCCSGEYLCKVTQFHKIDSTQPKNAKIPCTPQLSTSFRIASTEIFSVLANVLTHSKPKNNEALTFLLRFCIKEGSKHVNSFLVTSIEHKYGKNQFIRHQFLLTCSASIPAANNYLYVNSLGKYQ